MTLASATLLSAATVMLAGGVALVRKWPLMGMIGFLLVIAFVPIWVVVPSSFVSPSAASAAAGLVALALLLRSSGFRWTFADLLTSFLLITATAPLVSGLLPFKTVLGVVVIWCTAYITGRLVLLSVEPELLYAVIAITFGIVGLLAVVEFLTGWHGLSSWGPVNGARVTWGTIQDRAGLGRAEGAFGHSIALGTTLAMTSVLALQSRLPRAVRFACISLMVGGIGVTLSRGSLLCLGVGLALALCFLPSARVRELRVAVGITSLFGLVLLVPRLLDVFSEAGTEASGSAQYRTDLLTLLRSIELVGRSAAIQVTPEGTTYVGGFRSIDNQMLIFGLNFGWLMIVVVLLLLGAAAIALISGRGSAPSAALVAQSPALVTVALITQYEVFFWFVLGLAVGAEQLRTQKVHVDRVYSDGRNEPTSAIRGSRTMPDLDR